MNISTNHASEAHNENDCKELTINEINDKWEL